ncbi:SIS domain-containing protein [Ornithinimicrobium cavernae]|uniref:SIS domain-containing protein n=1 Tax=Ornithinimicrobium cavernae TaxID=2666047 RepID=UPI00137B9192|nr:SIS domain-containing protein [Ornithinimicrobium cavernae]
MTQRQPVRPLGSLPERFREKIDAAATPELERQVTDFVDKALKPTTRAIYLVGCGGSLFMFGAMRYLLERSPIPYVALNADEFMHRNPAALGADSIVIASSTNGGTKETARAVRFARDAGAPVLLVTTDPESIVAQEADDIVLHEGVEAKQILQGLIAYVLLKAQDAADDYDDAIEAFRGAARAFETSVQELNDHLRDIAAACVDEPVVYVLGSGPIQGAAETFAACYLQEMQVKHAVATGSGEFLHGAFEVVDGNVPTILFLGDDATRPMGERTLRFLETYNHRNYVIDVAALSLPGVPDSYRGIIGAFVMASCVTARLAQHFEAFSGRALTDRRYMWRVEY